MQEKSIMKKVAAFLERNYTVFFAGFIVLIMYVTQLISSGVYPFGDGYTVASYDLSAQICPFIEHLFDVLDGKSTLSYSYAIAAGADVTGSLLYFIISPFSFLFLILGDGKVAYATGFVMAAKLVCVAGAGAWFAKKLFNGIPDYLCIAVGVVYTYCGYMFVANTYITWIDFLIYMPFCVAAFRHFVKTGKFLPFSILVACCIYTCFSIASFSLFIVFPVLIIYALFCVEKEQKKRFIAYLCLSFVVAVLLALPVLLPALFAFMRSARGGGLFEEIWYGFELIDGKWVAKEGDYSFMTLYSTTVYKKWSYILSDSIFFLLTLVWIYRRDWKDPFVKFMLLAGALTLLPTIVDESMLLLNMGSYMQYSLRFGFLNAVYLLGGACLGLEGLCYNPKCAYDGTPLFETLGGVTTSEEGGMSETKSDKLKDKKENKYTYVILLSAIAAIAAAVLLYFIVDNNYKDEDFWGLLFKDSSSWSGLKGFSAAFAHTYGGMEVVLVFLVAVGVTFLTGAIFVGKKKISCRFLSVLMMIVVGVQVLFYNNQLVVGNLSQQHLDLAGYQTLAKQVNAMDDSYFRVKDFGKVNSKDERSDVWTVNVPFTGNTNAYSVFSSVIDADNFAVRNLFGYLGNNKNSIKSTHDTHGKTAICPEFGDSFMGYKYYFVLKDQRDEVEKESYVEKVMVENENGELVHLQVKTDNGKEVFVYENKIVFPNGYRVSSGEFRFVSEVTNGSTRKKNQAALYEFLRGENLKEFTGKDVVNEKSATELCEYLRSKAADVKVSAGKISAHVKEAKEGEYLFLNFVASKGYEVMVNDKKAELVDNDLKFLCVKLEAGENKVEFTYTSPYGKYALVGIAAAVVGLCAVALVLKKTNIMDKVAPVISVAGITLAVALVVFFMLYPSCVWLAKLAKTFLT